MIQLPWLETGASFPSVDQALAEPNGLLAAGGDLSVARLLEAYSSAIFPWYSEDDIDILWWSPDPRAIFPLKHYKIKKSLRKRIKSSSFVVTINQAFAEVMYQCAKPTPQRTDTWISQEMMDAYCQLHEQGHAQSIEIWDNHELIGGLYGVTVGSCFCGESMFTRRNDASKMAFFFLVDWLNQNEFQMLDCQMPNPHLMSLGALSLSREAYLSQLNQALKHTPNVNWHANQTYPVIDILNQQVQASTNKAEES